MAEGRFFTQVEFEQHIDRAVLVGKSSVLDSLHQDLSAQAVNLFNSGDDDKAIAMRNVAVVVKHYKEHSDQKLAEMNSKQRLAVVPTSATEEIGSQLEVSG